MASNPVTFLVVLIICLIFNNNVRGQGIVSEENRWNVKGSDAWFMGTETYQINGDSIVGNHIYKAIWLTFDSIDASWTYQGLLREDSNIVYYIPPGADEGILYDFNLDIGDTAHILNMFCTSYTTSAIITDIDTLEYLGYPRKRWHLQSDESGFEEVWMEGIGSNMGILHSLFYNCIVCPAWELLCCHQADTLIYQLSDEGCWVDDVGIIENHREPEVDIYPNPARDKFEVRSSEFGVEKILIFDIQGRRLLEKDCDKSMQVSIDCSAFEPDIYICLIQSTNQLITRKLIIQ